MRSRTFTVGTVTLALLGSACLTPASAATSAISAQAAANASKSTKKSKTTGPAILAPKNGARTGDHQVTIRVRAPHGVRSAVLNSTRLKHSEFSTASDGITHVVRASSSHGLRHGHNQLSVTINKRYRGKVTKTVTFSVKGKRLLTGAGRDRELVAGASLRLQGTTRRHPDLRDRDVATTWRLTRKPAGSNAKLTSSTGRSPRITTDLPGKYVVRAIGRFGTNARAGNRTATSDKVTISAPESPMVPFNAWSEDGVGNLGISVGGRFYPGSLPLQDSAWQMVIFDRKTLGVDEGHNRTYGLTAGQWYVASDGGGPRRPVDDMDDEFEGLDSSKMVVLVHRAQFGQRATPNPFIDLLDIPEQALPDPQRDDSAAIIGVPSGVNARVQAYVHDSAGKVDLSGYMVRDRDIQYTFVDDARVNFDTRAVQNCDKTACTVTIAIGEDNSPYGKVTRSFTAQDGQAGLGVVRLDRRTLAVRDAQLLLTNGSSPNQIRDNMVGASAYLKGIAADELVVISSVVAPRAVLMGKPSPLLGNQFGSRIEITGDAATELGAQIARFGGSRHRLLQAGVKRDDGYTLVGYRGLAEGQGHEMHAEDAQLSGVFQRDSSQMFITRAVNPGPDRFDTFTKMVSSAPGTVDFPGEGDPRFMQALRCLGNQLNAFKDAQNPRRLYWSGYFGTARPDWGQLSTDVSKLADSSCPGIDANYVSQVKEQFAEELDYLQLVDTYVEALKVPYSSAQTTTALTDTAQLAIQLKLSEQEAKDKQVSFDWWTLVATLVEAVAPFLAPAIGGSNKGVEHLVHALAAAAAGTLELAGVGVEKDEATSEKNEELEYQATVADLGSEITKKMVTATKTFDRMYEVVASDWNKLSSLGEALTICRKQERANPPIGPGDSRFTCDPSLYVSDDTKANAEAAASRAIMRTNYEALLPLTFPVVALPWDGVNTREFGKPEGNWDATLFTCFNASPFADPEDGEWKWPAGSKPFLRRSLGQYRDPNLEYAWTVDSQREALTALPQFDTYVIAQIGNRFNVETPVEHLEKLFGAAEDSSDPVDGGLGQDPVDYVLAQINEGNVQKLPLMCGGFEGVNKVPAPLQP